MRKIQLLALLSAGLNANLAQAALLPEQTVVLHASEPEEARRLAHNYAQGRGIERLCELDGNFPLSLSLTRYNDELWPAIKACLSEGPTSTIVTIKGLPVRVGNYSFEALLMLGESADREGPLRQRPRSQRPQLRNPLAPLTYDGLAMLQANRFPLPFSIQAGANLNLDLRIVSRIDGLSYAAAQGLVARGRQSDRNPPDGQWLCMQGSDEARAVRDQECEAVLTLLEEAGWLDDPLTLPFDSNLSDKRLSAYFTGSANLRGAIANNEYPVGAIADNITSLMGVPGNFDTFGLCQSDEDCEQGRCVLDHCLEERQTAIGRLIAAGITGTHAAAAEPYNNTFPSAFVLALYRAGYSLGESFFFALPFLGWVNVVYGDPFVAPFAKPVNLDGLPDQIRLTDTGYADLDLQAEPGWYLTRAAWFDDTAILHQDRFAEQAEQASFDWLATAPGPYRLRVWSSPKPTSGLVPLWPRNEAMSEKTIQLEPALPAAITEPPSDDAQGCSCHQTPLLTALLWASLGLRRRREPRRGA